VPRRAVLHTEDAQHDHRGQEAPLRRGELVGSIGLLLVILGIVLVLRTSGLISPAPRHWHGTPSPLLSAIHIIAEIQSPRVDPDGQSTARIHISGT
jgi:hypothetical protein